MGKSVTIKSGFSTVRFPGTTGASVYNSGDTVVFTNAEYAALGAADLRVLSSPAVSVPEPARPSTDTRGVPAVVLSAVATVFTAGPGYNAFMLPAGTSSLVLTGFAAGTRSSILVEVLQNPTTAGVLTQPVGVKWPAGTVPVVTASINKTDMFEYSSRDGGGTVFGRVLSANS